MNKKRTRDLLDDFKSNERRYLGFGSFTDGAEKDFEAQLHEYIRKVILCPECDQKFVTEDVIDFEVTCPHCFFSVEVVLNTIREF